MSTPNTRRATRHQQPTRQQPNQRHAPVLPPPNRQLRPDTVLRRLLGMAGKVRTVVVFTYMRKQGYTEQQTLMAAKWLGFPCDWMRFDEVDLDLIHGRLEAEERAERARIAAAERRSLVTPGVGRKV